MICKLFEYKIIKTKHFHSRHLSQKGAAYAIVTTTTLIAEPDAVPRVNLDDKDDMFVVARDENRAASMLDTYLENLENDVQEVVGNVTSMKKEAYQWKQYRDT